MGRWFLTSSSNVVSEQLSVSYLQGSYHKSFALPPASGSSMMTILTCIDNEDICGDDEMMFADGDGDWQMIIVDSLCDFGLPCPEESTTVPHDN